MASFMLDSNIWERLVAPEDYKECADFQPLKEKAFASDIHKFYISSTVFDLEDICHKDRLVKLKNYEPEMDVSCSVEGDTLHMTFTLEPGDLEYLTNSYLEKHFEDALKLGMKVVNFGRTGVPLNSMYSNYEITPNDEQYNLISQASEYIEQHLHAGKYAFKDVLARYGISYNFNDDFLQLLKSLPETAVKPFSEAVAEFSDGETLAMYIGMGFDYFVTDDKAKGAGKDSIFSQTKLNALIQQYPDIKIIDSKTMMNIL